MILTIIGARPQFIKAAPLSKAMKIAGLEERIIHTGQHYDYKMSEVFFEELAILGVALNLEIGSGNHGEQTDKMLIEIENYVLQNKDNIDSILVYGDTNSTLAGALVGAKLHIPVIHVEAGLRSFNRQMPAEVNRVMTDHLSDVLFCRSEEGEEQLAKEGITKNVYLVGDVMQDALYSFLPSAKKPDG
jgi:UDP-N-acetylglucosamine 2-epimerase